MINFFTCIAFVLRKKLITSEPRSTQNDLDIYIVLQIMPNRNPEIHYSLLDVQTIRKHFLNIYLNDVNHSIFRKTQ
jgi:hypothetical protein